MGGNKYAYLSTYLYNNRWADRTKKKKNQENKHGARKIVIGSKAGRDKNKRKFENSIVDKEARWESKKRDETFCRDLCQGGKKGSMVLVR